MQDQLLVDELVVCLVQDDHGVLRYDQGGQLALMCRWDYALSRQAHPRGCVFYGSLVDLTQLLVAKQHHELASAGGPKLVDHDHEGRYYAALAKPSRHTVDLAIPRLGQKQCIMGSRVSNG